jgi:hypothetical protein
LRFQFRATLKKRSFYVFFVPIFRFGRLEKCEVFKVFFLLFQFRATFKKRNFFVLFLAFAAIFLVLWLAILVGDTLKPLAFKGF